MTADGERDILGLWAGDGGEGAKCWLHVLTEIKNRGVADALIVVCDGLSGLPDAVTGWRPWAPRSCGPATTGGAYTVTMRDPEGNELCLA